MSASNTEPEPGLGASEEPALRVVGIGASAGGLVAVRTLLHALPAGFPMAIVVVMHLDPHHESSLAELLARSGPLPVAPAVEGAPLQAGHVSVITPNTIMTVEAGRLRLTPRPSTPEPQHPIDVCFRSLARDYDDHSLGVVLSGTGSDGTSGLMAIKGAGGITFAQDDSADHADMPRSAVASGCVDACLSPEQIAAELRRISCHPYTAVIADVPPEDPRLQGDEELLTALALKLSRISGINFTHYKQSTVRRRIGRRVVLLRLERLDEYVAYFDEHVEEAKTLAQDILIHVTSFFRDPEAFEAIVAQVFPRLVEDRPVDQPIRLWVPGCATGEEVYSLAICLIEFLEQHSLAIPIKLFGTDVSEEVIAHARSGRYTMSIAADVSTERLRRFFVEADGGYVITKAVRDLCVFARQDATRDPPFSNIDLISCRNLMIYLGRALQQRIVPMFHYALRDDGFLVLGTAETVGVMDELFEVLDKPCSIHRRRPVPRRLSFGMAGPDQRPHPAGPGVRLAWNPVGGFDAQHEADRLLLARYAPPGVVIDESLQILQFRGDTSAFLTQAPGTPSHDVLRMARAGLLPGLRALIDEGLEANRPARRNDLRTHVGERELRVDVELVPFQLPDSSGRYFLILFEQRPEASAPPTASAAGPVPVTTTAGEAGDSSHVARLEVELTTTREYLRANVERLEAANEELRAANEEILSSNEELQSTNEELQTAKEEYQATNEELLTVNEELRQRHLEVSSLGDDLTNLLTSARLPIVMVGRDLRLRRFTPSAAAVLGLRPSHVGSKILAIELALRIERLEALLLEVLDTFVPHESEVQDAHGRWYVLGIQPYRTEDDRIDGAVITLTDIDARKRSAERLSEARDFAQAIVLSVHEPLLVLGADLTVETSNRAYHEVFGTTTEVVEGLRLGSSAATGWVTGELRQRLSEIARTGGTLDELSLVAERAGEGPRTLRLNARALDWRDGRDGPRRVLLAVDDVTERERISRRIEESQRLESLGVLAGGVAHDFNNIITVILGFTEVMADALPPNSPAHALGDTVKDACLRAAELCSQMLAYSGRGRLVIAPLSLTELVSGSQRLLATMAGRHVELTFDLDTVPAQTCGDAVQLRQVLMNLVINASEALPEEGGRIVVSTGRMDAGREWLAQAQVSDVPAGEFVFLHVADDGEGMRPEVLARIFDPFFTTKFTGRGLGLASVLGIVRAHGGALRVDSTPGAGTRFWVLLPMAQNVDVPARPQPVAMPTQGTPWRGHGTVLIIDDERDVRAVIVHMLTQLGFSTLEASGGREGLERFARARDDIVLVLLDLTMPSMSGESVFRQLRELDEELPIVLMSGYDEDNVRRKLAGTTLSAFLPKPFGLASITRAMRRALTEPGELPAD